MPSVLVHHIVVEFEDGSPETFLADDVHLLQVVLRRLHVTAIATPEMLKRTRAAQNRRVNFVTFSYTAGDGQDYETRVKAGGPGIVDGADQIRYRRASQDAPIELLPVPPEVIPAGKLRSRYEEGGTFAVEAHGPRSAYVKSKYAEVAWHRWDCTWYYPY